MVDLSGDVTLNGKLVWAPDAKQVWLNVDRERIQLQRSEGGWWSCQRPLAHGELYTFDVDQKKKLPDPRSVSQPEGSHGRSCVVDHATFEWSDSQWRPPAWQSAILYELHVGTFTSTGTFDGVLDRLDHLVDLGVTHIEVMPIGEYPGSRGWGYDVVFPFAAHHVYGGPDSFKRMVNSCHSHGLAVILDVVYNHLGPSGNVLPRFGPYFSKRYTTPWGPGFNFDGSQCDEVRRYICDNALMWLRDFHVDGLRIDSVHEMVDTSAAHILEQLVSEVSNLEKELGRALVIIGEDGRNAPWYSRPRDQGGVGMTAQWTNDVGMALHTVLTGETNGWYRDYGSWNQVATAIRQPFVYDGKYSTQRQQTFGRPVLNLPPERFVAYLQNHDFTGNRQLGDRIGHLASVDDLKLASALLLLLPYAPLIFQGEEWNATSPFLFFADCHGDDLLTEGAMKGRAMAAESLGWPLDEAPDPGDAETFERSKLEWRELEEPEHQEIVAWYRSLIRIRNAYHRTGVASCVTDDAVLVVGVGQLQIICNLDSDSKTIAVGADQGVKVLLQSTANCKVIDDEVVLPSHSVMVLLHGNVGREQATATATDQNGTCSEIASRISARKS